MFGDGRLIGNKETSSFIEKHSIKQTILLMKWLGEPEYYGKEKLKEDEK